MNRLIKIVVFCLCFHVTPLLAQPNRDKVEELRVTFISKRLELSESESQKFWPIYNEYNQKLRGMKKNLRQSFLQKPKPLSDADAEELYQLDLQTRQAELNLYKEYSQKLKEIIGVKKLIRLHIAEQEFKRQVISSIQQEREDQ